MNSFTLSIQVGWELLIGEYSGNKISRFTEYFREHSLYREHTTAILLEYTLQRLYPVTVLRVLYIYVLLVLHVCRDSVSSYS